MIPISPLILCSAVTLAASSCLIAATPVTFNWFEYSGKNPSTTPKASAGEYNNPILTGFYPDPSICRVGEDYYLINSTFAYFPGIPIFHSKDLVNWQQIGHVIDRPGQLRYEGLGVSAAIFAPAISYHNGVFYVICTMVGSNGNFVVTATNPAGPWSDPTILQFGGIDPSLFFDDDGRAWVVNNDDPEGAPLYRGHRAIRLQEFDPVAKKMVGPRKVLVNGGVDISKKPIWIEGPHLYKREGWYYLMAAEGGTGPDHSEVVFRSKKVDGPYEPWSKNPILTQRTLDSHAPGAVTCAGHADLVEGPDKQWWAVFLGVRPYEGRFSPMGRETYLLPVKWTADAWPSILPMEERIPLVHQSPNGVQLVPSSTLPLSGDFSWRDDFKEKTLSSAWIMLRTPPQDPWWKIRTEGDGISLTPRTELLSGSGNPSYLARRVQHAQFTTSTQLEVPKESGVSAGLAVFQNETHHYFLAVRREGTGASIYLESLNGGAAKILASAPIPADSKIKLRITGHDAKCSFEYATATSGWKTLANDLDATLLTTDVAGGFVGATTGPHVRIDQ